MANCSPDFARTAVDYARHRAGFPPELLDRLAALGVVRLGARVVDLGTGTGNLARLFAQHGCEVTGVDIAAPLLEQARRLDREAGVEIAYVEGPAEATGLPEGRFDVVSAGQCWHWFDRPAAAREVARLLVSGGSAVIAHFDWLPIEGNVVAATEEIILHYTPSWPFADRAGLYPRWLVDLQTAGFTGIETFSFGTRSGGQSVNLCTDQAASRVHPEGGMGLTLAGRCIMNVSPACARLMTSRISSWISPRIGPSSSSVES